MSCLGSVGHEHPTGSSARSGDADDALDIDGSARETEPPHGYRALMFIFGIDVGSVRRPGGFSWAGIDDEGGLQAVGKDNPQALAEAVIDRLRLGSLVALAFESPLSVPVPLDWHDLGRARDGEGRRPWSAGAGAGALATGLVQAAWTCRHIAQSVPHVRATTQPDRLGNGTCQLLIAEALVAADGNPRPLKATRTMPMPSPPQNVWLG